MYIEWLIIYILYIQGGPKWYCNRVIFKYLTVVFFIGKEGMRSGPSRFRRGEGPPQGDLSTGESDRFNGSYTKY